MIRCPRCSAHDFTQIDLEVSVDEQVTFYSCRKCEEKWWDRAGATIALDEVLENVSTNTPASRRIRSRERTS